VETVNGVRTLYARDLAEWRSWLEENCRSGEAVWLIVYNKGSSTPSVRWHDAIENALCYGWVDSKAVKRDRESCYLCFSPRNPNSTWGRMNRQRAEKMIEAGLMRPRGQELIDHAKAIGTWAKLADAQNLVIPGDLQAAFDENEMAFGYFRAFPPSSRRVILEWIAQAKKPETRQRRIQKTVELAARNERASHSAGRPR
jgi:uncharacterized protein YdeI (YjbR/CyaY-like superfamily)